MYRYIGYTGGMTGIGMFFVVVAVVLLVVILSVVKGLLNDLKKVGLVRKKGEKFRAI